MTQDHQAITVRIPQDEYEQLRKLSFETRIPMAAIIREAVKLRLRAPEHATGFHEMTKGEIEKEQKDEPKKAVCINCGHLASRHPNWGPCERCQCQRFWLDEDISV